MSIRPLNELKCPLDIQMSICPLDKQKCPLDIQMSIRPLDEQKCPLDIQMFTRPLDEWTNGHCLMASTLVSYPHGPDSVKLRHYSFLGIVSVTCPLDIYKCPIVHWTNRNVYWTFKCPFVHWTNRNVHWTSKCPFVHWTNGHCLMASTLVSYPHGVRLSQITSLQLPWHRKRYMSIGHI